MKYIGYKRFGLLAMALLLGTVAHAQLGSVLRKAKKKIGNKIEKEVTQPSPEKAESKEKDYSNEAEHQAELERKFPNDPEKQAEYAKKIEAYKQRQAAEQQAALKKANGRGIEVSVIPSPIESAESEKFLDHQLYLLNRTKYLKLPAYDGRFADTKGLSGYYHLSQYFVRGPSSHFDNKPGDIYEGFSINYDPSTYELSAYFSADQVRYGVVPEQYQKSADKGNIQFQFGMGGGPEWTNANVLLLEPGVLLIGAEVYHKNETIGHQWMNNAEPKEFVIAAKDPEKIKKYYKSPELTSSVVFSKFDGLRKDAMGAEMDKVFMPAKGSFDSNPRLKAIAVKGLDAYYGKTSMQNTMQYLTSNKWSTVKHKVTGVPLYQWAVGAVIQQNSDGECMLQQFIIRQDYTGGGGYGTPYFNGINRGSVRAPYGNYIKCDAKP